MGRARQLIHLSFCHCEIKWACGGGLVTIFYNLYAKKFSYLPDFRAWQQDYDEFHPDNSFFFFFFFPNNGIIKTCFCLHSYLKLWLLSFPKVFQTFYFCCCYSPPLCSLYKVSKSRNCSSVVLLFSLCGEMFRVRVAFFFPFQNKELYILFHKYTGRNGASFQYEKLLCLLFLKNSYLGYVF